MLRTLRIKDFILVDELEQEFGPGFTVLTGETGAGKSILIDALMLALGGRADAATVRMGQPRTEVSAEFDIAGLSDLARWLEEQGLEGDPGTCLLRRTVDAGGRSRAYINGHAATLQQLRDASDHLVDIHGQHAHQSLLRPAMQRELLDGFGGLAGLAGETAVAWRNWREAERALRVCRANLGRDESERERLGWMVADIEKLGFDPMDWEELQAQQHRLAHASLLLEGSQWCAAFLSEQDGGVDSQLRAVSGRLTDLVEFDPELRSCLDQLETASIQVRDAAHALRDYGSRLDIDPAELREADRRIAEVLDTARKYRVTPEELPAALTEARAGLLALGGGASLEQIEATVAQMRRNYLDRAERLTGERGKAAESLGRAVTEAMQDLAMSGGKFEVALNTFPTGTITGMEDVEFFVSAHRGLPLRPLSKVASGGELSRLSLAIQTVSSRIAGVRTLIFDEVDVGIGGGVAEIVGQMLERLGASRQVLVITHLPQVASRGARHWRIVKTHCDGVVLSRIQVLEHEDRIEEIARMLGGVEITGKTRAHAKEMLERAETTAR
jgi:DNA repair protein RecN (Recombination protein N)